MKFLISFLLFLPLFLRAQEIPKRNLLSNPWAADKLSEILLSADDWKYFPTYTDRGSWDKLPETIKQGIVQRGDDALDFTWPPIPASLYLEYTRNGNRSNFQTLYFERRAKLADLVLAEVISQSGRYLDQIVNGIWAVSEESSWCIPAHLSLQEGGHSGLPKPGEEVVDLFAAETGATLAWTYYFLHEQLEGISPAVTERIEFEIGNRILSPLRERMDFWWMGFGTRKIVNNWNPWIISNWLTIAQIMEKDPLVRAQSIHKAIVCLDNFINFLPADGGCDEGPGYWGRAGASLFDCLDLLHSMTAGEIDLFDKPLIRNTAAYITKAYIKQPYYLNFADASAKTTPDPVTVYRFGKAVQDKDMMAFGGFLRQQNGVQLGSSYSFGRLLNAILHYQELQDAPIAEPLFQDVWLPDLEVFTARGVKDSASGFYLAGKGGHNDESHNHNDVGNYIIYYDGLPLIIDVGVEEYRRQTFSKERYSIWTMQSQYHNLPTVNGHMQAPGRNFESNAVLYKADAKQVRFSLDIANAYPDEAGVTKWKRELDFKRGRAIQVRETYELEQVSGELSLFFITPCRPVTDPKGRIRFHEKNGAFTVDLLINDRAFEVFVESIAVVDSQLLRVWGDEIFRIKLKVKYPKKKGVLKYKFQSAS